LALVVAGSLVLNRWNADFPYTYHADERKKVRFVGELAPDFNHPILLIHAARLPNAFLGYTDPQQIVQLGRAVSCLAGLAIVVMAYFMSRRALGDVGALWVSAAAATSPLLVIHAHYFKEDMLFGATTLASVLTFGWFVEKPQSNKRLIALALVTALAAATKYLGALLVPAYMLVLTLQRPPMKRARDRLPLALLIGFGAWLLINYPALLDVSTFWRGVRKEARHVALGHGTVAISPLDHFFTFHFRHSLIDAMTLGVALLALAAVVYLLLRFRTLRVRDQAMLLACVGCYFLAELSPSKPFPDFSRYMVPLAAPLLYFVALATAKLAEENRPLIVSASIVLLAASGCAAIETFRLVHHMSRDTRDEAIRLIKQKGESRVRAEQYAGKDRHDTRSIVTDDLGRLRAKGIEFVAVSSFVYDRYRLAAPGSADRALGQYELLFGLPHVEFKPAYRSFGFNNPTVRVIDIRVIPAEWGDSSRNAPRDGDDED
ncbi:MAG: ArnT family glycosyltransferase, partial [Tepidisphaeraceae bacterium]